MLDIFGSNGDNNGKKALVSNTSDSNFNKKSHTPQYDNNAGYGNLQNQGSVSMKSLKKGVMGLMTPTQKDDFVSLHVNSNLSPNSNNYLNMKINNAKLNEKRNPTSATK